MKNASTEAPVHQHDHLSDYCIIDHFDRSVPNPPVKWWRMLMVVPYYLLDRKMHFTGLRGGLWRMIGVGIGISTGLAYTGVVGSDNCNEYTALGDTVNIASRLQGEAAGGEVLVTSEVYEKIGGGAGAVHRTLQLKGISEPVEAYTLSVGA